MSAHPADLLPPAVALEIVGAVNLARGTLMKDRDISKSNSWSGLALAVGWRMADDSRTRVGLALLAGGFVLQLAGFGVQSLTSDTDAPSWWAYLVALVTAVGCWFGVARAHDAMVHRRVVAFLGDPERTHTADWTKFILHGAGYDQPDGEGDVAFVERVGGVRLHATEEEARRSAADEQSGR